MQIQPATLRTLSEIGDTVAREVYQTWLRRNNQFTEVKVHWDEDIGYLVECRPRPYDTHSLDDNWFR